VINPCFLFDPVRRECYSEAVLQHAEYDGLSAEDKEPGRMTDEDWEGYRRTVRKVDAPIDEYKPGRYAVEQRRRAKREKE